MPLILNAAQRAMVKVEKQRDSRYRYLLRYLLSTLGNIERINELHYCQFKTTYYDLKQTSGRAFHDTQEVPGQIPNTIEVNNISKEVVHKLSKTKAVSWLT